MSRSPACCPSSSNGSLDVLIVGGGLCGLAAAISVALSGHRATVFEAFEAVHPFGSGVQLSPNGTRLLLKWGLGDILDPVLTTPGALRIHEFNGEILASRDDYAEEVLRRYRFPTWTLHRVDLQRGLTRRANDLGVQIHYSSRVIDVDCSKTTITFANGERRRGDLVVVANGTASTLRRNLLAQDIVPRPAGYTAYRITVDCAPLLDRGLLDLASSSTSRLWAGQDAYALCSPIRRGAQLSVLLVKSRDVSSGSVSVSTSAAVEELKKLAESWDRLLTAIFTAAQRVNKWQLVLVPPPSTMVSSEATCVLAGDCCHSIHPFLGQGLNLGLEDAAVLGHLLRHVKSPGQVPEAVALYDRLRTDRARKLDDETRLQIGKLHSFDGPPQTDSNMESGNTSFTLHDWVGAVEHQWIWSYDAFDEAEKAYANEPF